MAIDITKYPWYEEIYRSDTLTQGDILLKCPIPILDKSVYDALASGSEFSDNSTGTIDPDVVIITQACDLEQDKIDSVVVCMLVSLAAVQLKNPDFLTPKRIDNLRQGKEPPLHLLNAHSSERIVADYSVVNFHHLYCLPKGFLREVARAHEYRLRLLPPYREHLSRAFARYFMRVGLPIDIDKNSLLKRQVY
jgi:hypothetical protein